MLTQRAEVLRRYIRFVRKAVNGNKVHAARILGLDKRVLYRRAIERAEPGVRVI